MAWTASPDSGTSDHERRVGRLRDVDLALPDPDGLDDHHPEAGGIEDVACGLGGFAESAEGASGRQAAHEHVVVLGPAVHPDAIAQQRAARKRARGVHGHDGHTLAATSKGSNQTVGQRRLAGAGRSGDTDPPGGPGVRVESVHQALRALEAVLDGRQRPCDGAALALEDGRSEGGGVRHDARSPAPPVMGYRTTSPFSDKPTWARRSRDVDSHVPTQIWYVPLSADLRSIRGSLPVASSLQ